MKDLIAQSDERAKFEAPLVGEHALYERIERLDAAGQVESQKTLGRVDQNKQRIKIV